MFGRCITIRKSKKITFIELNDGTTLQNVQLVVFHDQINLDSYSLSINTSIEVEGYVKETPKREQPFELKVSSLKIINLSDDVTYPLQKKEHTLEFLRTIQQYRLSTKLLQNVHRTRQSIITALFTYLEKHGYMWVHTPIITTNDAEGAGEVFEVDPNNDFFPKSTYLTVSGQLNAEISAQAFHKVFAFGPTFRAEKSDTSIHAAEFWMLEPEVTFYDQVKMIEEIKNTLSYVVNYLLIHNKFSLKYLSEINNTNLDERLKQIKNKEFQEIYYKDALKILKKVVDKEKFEFKNFAFGRPLQREHEQYLCKYFKKPIIIKNFPLAESPFYMYDNGDGTSRSYDFVVPKAGEIVGGSQREDRYHFLKKQVEKKGNPSTLEWYLNMRKHGYATSSGYGLGIERLVMYFTGMKNIRDIQLFPRTYKQISF